MLKRSRESHFYGGQWDLPGGKVDKGEDFATALLREIREETGLRAKLTGLAGVAYDELPKVRVIILAMTAQRSTGRVRISNEHEEFAWVPRKDLPRRNLSPQVKPILLSFIRKKK